MPDYIQIGNQGGGATLIENCIRCGRPTPYNQSTPVDIRKWYVDGSGQLCEQCFSQLYSSSSAFCNTPTQAKEYQKDKEEQGRTEGHIKKITLPIPTTPTQADQDRYNQLINKTTLTDEDREELKRLYKKYTGV